MSLRSLLMPAISQRLLSRERLESRRRLAERARVRKKERHQVHYFHQVDDPYSALAAASLARLVARYDIDLLAHLVGVPSDAAAPERDKLVAYSRRDAQLLAQHFGIAFSDPGQQPSAHKQQQVAGKLLSAIDAQRFVEVAGPLSLQLWQPDAELTHGIGHELPVASASAVATHSTASDALRQRWGHYLGATFYYAGEWYWGLDRLCHLEWRLQVLGAARGAMDDLMFPPMPDLVAPVAVADPVPIDFFFSLRSPYSAIVAQRVFALGRATGAPVRLRYLLPMVMRGLPVPREKRNYISQDAAREAFVRGIPFGRLNDPLGRPTERGLAIIPYAERAGKAQDYLLSFMQGVWAEGIDAGSERGLRKIVERAGLSWPLAQQALLSEDWRQTAEQNRAEMFGLGLWGVPSFRVRDTAVWGQDRLWAIQQALLQGPQPLKAGV